MDLNKALKAQENRKTRNSRPFNNFYEMFTQCYQALEAISSGSCPKELIPLLERSIVITTITAIEVYYRDMLVIIFEKCSPQFYEQKLKQLHPEKYSINDLVEIYQQGMDPLELLSSSQSFQSMEKIEKVFSIFLEKGKGFWDSVMNLQFRIKDKPETETAYNDKEYESMKAMFELRHELVHDPARISIMDQKVANNLWNTGGMILGSDIILTNLIEENKGDTSSKVYDESASTATHSDFLTKKITREVKGKKK